MGNSQQPQAQPGPTRYAWLPYARLNLSRNPFGQLSPTDRVRAAVLTQQPWLETLTQKNAAIQFMGPAGHGKSTHLLALASACPDAAFVYLPAQRPYPSIPVGCPLFIDEAQRLPWMRRYRVFRRQVPLVLGTHRDLTPALRKAGYNVETVDVRQQCNPTKIHKMLNLRIELARLAPNRHTPEVSVQEVRNLIRSHGYNIRAIENQLYDQFQLQVSPPPTGANP